MKKLLVAFDGSRYSESALEYAISFGKPEHDLIVGIFIEDLSYAYMFTNFGVDPLGHELTSGYGTYIEEVRQQEESKLEANRKAFIKRCEAAGIRYNTHVEEGGTAQRLVEESLFADILITGYQVYFSNLAGEADQGVLKDVLGYANCPVLVVPESPRDIKNVVFAYDGGENAIYALKQFTYLLKPNLERVSTEVLNIQKNADDPLPHEELLQEYLHQHYPECPITSRPGRPDEALLQYLEDQPNAMVVMGSFGRNALSRFFSPSKAKGLLEDRSKPAFIAHR